MITSNIIHRVFRIRCGQSSGTAFAVDVDGRQYLITARHVVDNLSDGAGIAIFSNGAWCPTAMQAVGLGSGPSDVAVLAPDRRLSPADLPVEVSSAGFTYGQECYFLGFPYDFLGNVVFTEAGYHLPFVKRATLSCFAGDVYLLDGHNNPGFSGGPVVFGDPGRPPTKFGAVISGYKFAPEPVLVGNAVTNLTYKYNTGIIVCYKIEIAMSLIHANPIGASG
jgi:hypothetical protein